MVRRLGAMRRTGRPIATRRFERGAPHRLAIGHVEEEGPVRVCGQAGVDEYDGGLGRVRKHRPEMLTHEPVPTEEPAA
jgi:hypothetical protein